MKEYDCESCKHACSYRPGWFKPDEIEAAANLLGMTIEKFFKSKLAVDWWESDENIFLLAPAIKGKETGTEYPGDPHGECIFFKDGLCEIHKAKPFECKEYIHTESRASVKERHKEICDSWGDYQNMIEKLLGRKPKAKEYSGSGLFGMF